MVGNHVVSIFPPTATIGMPTRLVAVLLTARSGSSRYWFSSDEVDQLEDAFLERYNALNVISGHLCYPHFRRLGLVLGLNNIANDDSTFAEIHFLLFVAGHCQDCD